MEDIKVVKANDINLKLSDIGLDSAREDMSVNDFMGMLRNFKFNDPIQRNVVWSLAKKSLVIISMIEKVHIGEIKVQIIRKNKMKIRNTIDGKQRLTSVRDYVLNKYALKDVPLVKGYNENDEEVLIDLNGLTFNELPEFMQSRVKSYMLEIKVYEIDDETKNILFFRWNNGESLKPSEKRKAIMSDELLQYQNEIKDLPVLKEGFSESQINRDANGDLVLQYLLLLQHNYSTDLGGKAIDKSLDVLGTQVLEQAKESIEYLNEVYRLTPDELKVQVFNKTKTQANLCVSGIALEKKIEPELFVGWLEKFYVNPQTKNGEFIQNTNRGTTKKSFVEKRIEIAMNDFKEYLKEVTLL